MIGPMVVEVDPWVEIEAAAYRLARIHDGTDRVSEERCQQWQRRIWVWVHRAKAAGQPVPATRREGRRVRYRLIEVEEFAATRLNKP